MESTDPSTDAGTPPDPPPSRHSVWRIYKSRFLPTQAFILICVALMYFWLKMEPLTIGMTFLFVQLAAIWGAWSGKKFLERIEEGG